MTCSHRPLKKWGQHFLRDNWVLNKMVQAIRPTTTEWLIEIGPGEGVLTELLLPHVAHLDVIEIDPNLAARLQTRWKTEPRFTLHHQDALDCDPRTITQDPVRIVGNLPYQISTPLLFHLLETAPHAVDYHFLLQKEVVDRMCATANSDAYGRLSVMAQYHWQPTALFDVAPGSFCPPPQVQSTFVRLVPHTLPCLANDYAIFSKVVLEAFNHRRKTIYNALQRWIPTSVFESAELSPSVRPEVLAVEEFVRLANALTDHISSRDG